jgi:uncharacterized coiled-coil protein SlyX
VTNPLDEMPDFPPARLAEPGRSQAELRVRELEARIAQLEVTLTDLEVTLTDVARGSTHELVRYLLEKLIAAEKSDTVREPYGHE